MEMYEILEVVEHDGETWREPLRALVSKQEAMEQAAWMSDATLTRWEVDFVVVEQTAADGSPEPIERRQLSAYEDGQERRLTHALYAVNASGEREFVTDYVHPGLAAEYAAEVSEIAGMCEMDRVVVTYPDGVTPVEVWRGFAARWVNGERAAE